MKAGDLVRVKTPCSREALVLGIFLGYGGYKGSNVHSYVFVEGEKFLFLTCELEAVR